MISKRIREKGIENIVIELGRGGLKLVIRWKGWGTITHSKGHLEVLWNPTTLETAKNIHIHEGNLNVVTE